MVNLQVYITEEQHKELKIIYANTGQRITESIRQAIHMYLAEKEGVKK